MAGPARVLAGRCALGTGDHELDLVIRPDRTVTLKDADDLDAAVAAGLFTATEATAIHADAKLAKESFRQGDWPFSSEWVTWRPPPSWSVPDLLTEAQWAVDLIPE